MNNMKTELKLEVVRFDSMDVIATSVRAFLMTEENELVANLTAAIPSAPLNATQSAYYSPIDGYYEPTNQ